MESKKDYSKIKSLSSKDSEVLDLLFGDKITQPVDHVKNFEQMISGKKALILEDAGGRWYICGKMCIRFYRNIEGNTLRIQSHLATKGNTSRTYYMENGNVIYISRDTGGVTLEFIGLDKITYSLDLLTWKEPATNQELIDYKL